MAKLDEATSTERLLDLIRRKRPGSTPVAEKDGVGSVGSGSRGSRGGGPAGSILPRGGRILHLQKASVLGIDIGFDRLCLARTVSSGEKKRNLAGMKAVPIPQGVPRDSDEFAQFLKSAVEDFCGSDERIEIWALISAAQVEIRHIRIPKVPKKQIFNAVYWTAKKDSVIDEKEVIFDFEVQGEIAEQGIGKYSVMILTVPRREVEGAENLFARAGLPLAGVTITPFALQNLFRTGWMYGGDSAVANLYIGNDHSRIDIFVRGNLVMNRGIKAGSSSMAEAVMDAYNERRRLSHDTSDTVKNMTIEGARRALSGLNGEKETSLDGDGERGLAASELFAIVKPSLDRLIRQAERTFEYYVSHVGQDRIEKIYLAGAMNLGQTVVEYIGSQLGIEKEVLDPLDNNPSALLSGHWVPAAAERIAFAPALGVALSSNEYTPNFIFTHEDKEKKSRTTSLNRGVFAAFAMVMAICSGIFLYEVQALEKKKAEVAKLQAQLTSYVPRLHEAQVLQLAANARQLQAGLRSYGDRYLGMALIGEIAAVTPANVRLVGVKANFGPKAATKSPGSAPTGAKDAKGGGGGVLIEGYLSGDRRDLESLLAGYVMKLDSSPMFSKVLVQKNNVEAFKTEEVLHFILSTQIG